jgi:hypothetical protein
MTAVRHRQVTAVRRRPTLRQAETVALCLVGLLLAVATVYDLTREVRIDNRVHADVVSWRAITGSHDAGLLVKQDLQHGTTRDTVCGRVYPAYFFHERFFACLIFQGRVRGGRRAATGGYYYEAVYRDGRWWVHDHARNRYGCFGDAVAEGFRCGRGVPPGAPDRQFGRS